MPDFLFSYKAESTIKWLLCALHLVMFFFVPFVVRRDDSACSFVILLILQTKVSSILYLLDLVLLYSLCLIDFVCHLGAIYDKAAETNIIKIYLTSCFPFLLNYFQ